MTHFLLDTFPTFVLGLLIVVVPSLLVVFALWRVRLRYDWEVLAANNDQGGVLFSVVGTIYAIFLAFLVVVAWESLGEAEHSVTEEGATVLSLYRDIGALPEPARSQLRRGVADYTRAVIEHEWVAMAHGDESPEAHERLDRVWDDFIAVEPATPKEVAVYAEAFTRLNELAKQRKVRILASEAAIPELFWFLLLFGAFVTIGFTFFLGMRHMRVQLLLTGAMTAMIMSALFLIVVLDHPFTGDVKAEPVAFEQALAEMEH